MQTDPFDFWMFIAGLGIFLFGMHHLEGGIKGMAGKAFKKLLQRFTGKSWKGILTGTIVTGILQSSSMVNLLVLAFLGAGMIGLRNSLGVVLGANLGTTFTAWIVAALGFKMDIADFSFPFLAVGILSYLFLESRPFLKSLGGFLVGFGLLFLGLDFMKDSIANLTSHFDLASFKNYGLWAFLLTGLIITAIIQSSSAMIVIILSALNAGLIDIYQSLALAIGAHIGTTATLIIGALGGTADKKRLSLANFMFNAIVGVVLFFFIRQMVLFTRVVLNLTDPLLELVLLNSLITLIGILLFYPFLGIFERFLKGLFGKAIPKGETLYVKNIPPEVPDIALQAIDKELRQVFLYTRQFILECFRIREKGKSRDSQWKLIFSSATNLNKKYEQIKRLEDELISYYSQLQEKNLTEAESAHLTSSMMALRSMVYGAKDIKDIIHNISFISESDDKVGHEILSRLSTLLQQRLGEIDLFLEQEETGSEITTPQNWLKENEQLYNELITYIYRNIRHNEVPVSTLTNVVRQSISCLDNLCNSAVLRKSGKDTIPEKTEDYRHPLI